MSALLRAQWTLQANGVEFGPKLWYDLVAIKPADYDSDDEDEFVDDTTRAADGLDAPMEAVSKPKYDFSIVAEPDFPTGGKIRTGRPFIKTWLIQNTGETAWPDNVQVRAPPYSTD